MKTSSESNLPEGKHRCLYTAYHQIQEMFQIHPQLKALADKLTACGEESISHEEGKTARGKDGKMESEGESISHPTILPSDRLASSTVLPSDRLASPYSFPEDDEIQYCKNNEETK